MAEPGRRAQDRHTGVVHRDNADAHENTAEHEPERGRLAGGDHKKPDCGDPDCDDKGKKCQTKIITNGHRHKEGEHGDEVHRPNPASHGNCSRRKPSQPCPPLRDPDAAAEVKCGVGGKTRNRKRECDEVWIVGADNLHFLNRTVLQHPFAWHFVVTITNYLQWSQEGTKKVQNIVCPQRPTTRNGGERRAISGCRWAGPAARWATVSTYPSHRSTDLSRRKSTAKVAC